MSFSDAAHNGQTEAKAPHLSTAIRFQPIERKRDVIVHIVGDTRTVVVNCDTDLVAFLGEFKLNLTIGILDRVSKKVLNRPKKKPLISKGLDTWRQL